MPRASIAKSRLDAVQTAVCLRIREAREIAEVTQQGLAGRLGVTRDSLSTYEKCRAPLKVDLGLRICRQLIISEEWLATGKTDIFDRVARQRLGGVTADLRRRIFVRQCYDLFSEPAARAIPPGTLFTEGFNRYLADIYARLADRFFNFPRIILTDDVQEVDLASRFLSVLIGRALDLLGHLATKSKNDAWLVQRNFVRAMFSLSHKLYRDFVKESFDIPAFQQLVRGMERATLVQNQPQQSTRKAVA